MSQPRDNRSRPRSLVGDGCCPFLSTTNNNELLRLSLSQSKSNTQRLMVNIYQRYNRVTGQWEQRYNKDRIEVTKHIDALSHVLAFDEITDTNYGVRDIYLCYLQRRCVEETKARDSDGVARKLRKRTKLSQSSQSESTSPVLSSSSPPPTIVVEELHIGRIDRKSATFALQSVVPLSMIDATVDSIESVRISDGPAVIVLTKRNVVACHPTGDDSQPWAVSQCVRANDSHSDSNSHIAVGSRTDTNALCAIIDIFVGQPLSIQRYTCHPNSAIPLAVNDLPILLDSHQSLTCLYYDSDASRLYGCYSNSEMRVYDTSLTSLSNNGSGTQLAVTKNPAIHNLSVFDDQFYFQSMTKQLFVYRVNDLHTVIQTFEGIEHVLAVYGADCSRSVGLVSADYYRPKYESKWDGHSGLILFDGIADKRSTGGSDSGESLALLRDSIRARLYRAVEELEIHQRSINQEKLALVTDTLKHCDHQHAFASTADLLRCVSVNVLQRDSDSSSESWEVIVTLYNDSVQSMLLLSLQCITVNNDLSLQCDSVTNIIIPSHTTSAIKCRVTVLEQSPSQWSTSPVIVMAHVTLTIDCDGSRDIEIRKTIGAVKLNRGTVGHQCDGPVYTDSRDSESQSARQAHRHSDSDASVSIILQLLPSPAVTMPLTDWIHHIQSQMNLTPMPADTDTETVLLSPSLSLCCHVTVDVSNSNRLTMLLVSNDYNSTQSLARFLRSLFQLLQASFAFHWNDRHAHQSSRMALELLVRALGRECDESLRWFAELTNRVRSLSVSGNDDALRLSDAIGAVHRFALQSLERRQRTDEALMRYADARHAT